VSPERTVSSSLDSAREFWSQDDLGRDYLVAITYTAEEALIVWDALRRARSYVEERTHTEYYRGKFIRSWSEDEGYLYPADLERLGISS